MEYKQANKGPQSKELKVHAVRWNESALCGHSPKFGWNDKLECKKEDVNCPICQKYIKTLEFKNK